MENHRNETIVIFAGYPEEMELISEKEAEKRGFMIQTEADFSAASILDAEKVAVSIGFRVA